MNARSRIPPSLAPRDEPLDPDATLVAEPLAAEAPPRSPWRSLGRWLKRTFWLLVVLVLLVALAPPAAVWWLRSHPPPLTSFMRQSEVQPVQYKWVPAARIPSALRQAVIASEDQKFRSHWGFDFYAIAEALEHNEKSRKKRGASTITQQTAKNLFLWPSRSWLRKGLEVTFTLLLEGELSKDRILEIYLNIVEFGPGIYGVEAAAENFFHKPAEKLTLVECAQLAAVLPNPRKWHADRPGPYVQSRVDWILGQLGQGPRFSSAPGETETPPESPEGEDPENGEPAPPEDPGEPAGPDPDAPLPDAIPAGDEPSSPGPPTEPPAEAPAPAEAPRRY